MSVPLSAEPPRPGGAALARESWRGIALFMLALALVIFLPAWSLTYWQGWLYWVVFGGAVAGITAYFLRNDPALVRRRLLAGAGAETEATQRRIQSVTAVLFMATFILSGLDHHFAWSPVPPWAVIVADVLVAAGFTGVFLTFRENSFAGGTIRVDSGQQVITTGPYAIVRHPMYVTAGLMILATPVALGSWWGLVPAVLVVAAIVVRLLDEERFLVLNLPGYARYMRRTRSRLLPRVW